MTLGASSSLELVQLTNLQRTGLPFQGLESHVITSLYTSFPATLMPSTTTTVAAYSYCVLCRSQLYELKLASKHPVDCAAHCEPWTVTPS